MTKRSWIRGALWALVVVLVCIVALAAWYAIPILTHAPGGSSGQEVSTGDAFDDSGSATGDDGRTRVLSVTDENGDALELSNVAPGTHAIVSGSGYDSAVGIYVAVCVIPETVALKPSPCVGGSAQPTAVADGSADWSPSAWINADPKWRVFGAQDWTGEGAFEVRLALEADDGTANCFEQRCAIYTRSDHTAANDRVQDLHLPLAFAR